MPDVPSLPDRFSGCLLGLAVGDALGAFIEGQSAESIGRRFPTVEDLIRRPPDGDLWYTDGTQTPLGVAETLIACGRIEEEEICRRSAEHYETDRG